MEAISLGDINNLFHMCGTLVLSNSKFDFFYFSFIRNKHNIFDCSNILFISSSLKHHLQKSVSAAKFLSKGNSAKWMHIQVHRQNFVVGNTIKTNVLMKLG